MDFDRWGPDDQYDREPLVRDAEVGYNAKRTGVCGCTDCLFLLVFIVVMGAYGALAYVAMDKGNPLRLIYGTDYLGNVCGQTGSKNSPRQPPPEQLPAPWKDLDHLWYPFDPTKPGEYDDAIDLGVCVERCPADGDTVTMYGATPKQFHVQYDSSAKLRRCVPLSNSTVADARGLIDIASKVYDGVAQCGAAWKTILYAMAVALGVALVWLLLVNLFATPMVFVSILAVAGAAGGGGYLLWEHSKDLSDDGNSDYKWVRAGAIALFVVCGLVLLMTVFMIKQICLGARVVKEASKVMLSTPTIFLVPVVATVLLAAFIVFCLWVMLSVQTMHDYENEELVGVNISAFVQSVPYSRTAFQLYGVFSFFWGTVFLQDLSYLVVALVAAFWFFSGSETKHPPCCSPLRAMGTAVRHHVGTIALGSFIIAVCKFVRFLIMRIQGRLEKTLGNSNALRCVVCLAQCCVSYIERVLKFLSESAYCITAIDGSSFCGGARKAIALIVLNPVQIAAVHIVSGIMTFIGRLLVVSGAVFWAYLALDKWDISPEVDSYWVPLIVTGVLAYVLCGAVVYLFSVTIDALAFCHFVDEERFEGRFSSEDAKASLARVAPHRRQHAPVME
eukprot:TRINITY_DN1579_c0_g2_i1.p1 TRINITY_DN1579_c0_g2~~TRINITY_DN1579_c0_g2_i1.p1  ORF type:complete len:616 (+),score=167.81 TRINITY_DN1579_c0_g2_i1:124-1971(+)